MSEETTKPEVSEKTLAEGQEATEEHASSEDEDFSKGKAKKARKPHGRIYIVGIVIAVIVVAGLGFNAWHNTPGFCAAICHSPMDPYLATYNETPGQPGTDKWGNEVSDAKSMLAPVHRMAGKGCMTCHPSVLSQQISEGTEWLTGNYDDPIPERTITQLIENRGSNEASDSDCMNSSCHNFTREDLIKKTAWMGAINPHYPQHGVQECSTCHKAHRASVMYCSQCHTEAVVPDGWVSYTDSQQAKSN